MTSESRPYANGLSDVRQLWALEAELRRQGELQDWYRKSIDKELGRLERRVTGVEDGLDKLKSSINGAIRWLAVAAGAIVFELLRKGVTF
jgi:hypothetical protein